MTTKTFIAWLAACSLIASTISAYAGGGFDDYTPVIPGPCNVMIEPSDIPAERGKKWKRLRSVDRLKIASQGKEIREFQVLYCRDYDKTNNFVREYVKSEEWYR